MQTLQLGEKSREVSFLTELLIQLGYNLILTDFFDGSVLKAVKDFQRTNNLVVDGIVGLKSWLKLIEKNQNITADNDKLLSEQDLIDFANLYQIELATIKAVNEVESAGKGFLVNGKAKILFEGHIFWRELEKRGINPKQYVNNATRDILYQRWTKAYYKGGEGEYQRLQKAMMLNPAKVFKDAANASASWGSFQIMGFNAVPIGYASLDEFVTKMQIHEREHLKAFGRYLQTYNLIELLRTKQWRKFASKYNGPDYTVNKYDEKLAAAYQKYSN